MTVYIVFSSARLAGCEKRIIGTFQAILSLNEARVLHLVAYSSLLARLAAAAEFESILSHPRVFVHSLGEYKSSYVSFWLRCFSFFIDKKVPIAVHYPLAYPIGIKYIFGHKTILSWTSNTTPSARYLRLAPRIITWLSILEADLVDVLSPSNWKKFKIYSWFSDMRLTMGGTHVNPYTYYPGKKEYNAVFLSRFDAQKQGFRLVSVLPDVCKLLTESGIPFPSFTICGWGAEESLIRSEILSDAFRNLDISVISSDGPASLLSRSMIFFSLQRESNYPSRSLAEAIVSGLYPIITNSPDSELMISSQIPHQLIPINFTSYDIAAAIIAFNSSYQQRGGNLFELLSGYGRERFSTIDQASYYADIYDSLCKTI